MTVLSGSSAWSRKATHRWPSSAASDWRRKARDQPAQIGTGPGELPALHGPQAAHDAPEPGHRGPGHARVPEHPAQSRGRAAGALQEPGRSLHDPAPHSGYVVYANRSGRAPMVYEGAPVRERMPLFTLPDQSKLEVEVLLHETIIQRVRAGMAVAIRLEALPDLRLTGVLSAVSPVPISDRNPESGNDATYFVGHVQLTTMPANLRPGMTTQVSISTGLRRESWRYRPWPSRSRTTGKSATCTMKSRWTRRRGQGDAGLPGHARSDRRAERGRRSFPGAVVSRLAYCPVIKRDASHCYRDSSRRLWGQCPAHGETVN